MIKDENFLEESFGNFLDYIENEVYVLQTCINIFNNNIDIIYDEYKNPNINDGLRSLLKFLILESDSILRCKMIMFVVNIENMIINKHEMLINNIKAHSDMQYEISKEAYMHLDSYQDNIDWDSFNLAHIHFTSIKEMDLDGFLKSEYRKNSIIKFKKFQKTVSSDDLIMIINTAFMKLSLTLMHYKRITEKTKSLAINYELCKRIVSLLICVYFVISATKIKE